MLRIFMPLMAFFVTATASAAVQERPASNTSNYRKIHLECEYYKGSVGRYTISWDDSNLKNPAVVTESSSLSYGDGRATRTEFVWEKDLSTFHLDRKTLRLKIIPKDGYKTLEAPCVLIKTD